MVPPLSCEPPQLGLPHPGLHFRRGTLRSHAPRRERPRPTSTASLLPGWGVRLACFAQGLSLLCELLRFFAPTVPLQGVSARSFRSLGRAGQGTVMAAELRHPEPEAPPTLCCGLPLLQVALLGALSPGPGNAEQRLAPQGERPFRRFAGLGMRTASCCRQPLQRKAWTGSS